MKTNKLKKRKLWLNIIITTAILLFSGVGVYSFLIFNSIQKAVDSIHEPLERDMSEKRQEQVILAKKEAFSVLMLGVDERKGDRGRSDTMIVLTVNPTLNSVKMLSIPRDTRTEIVGKGIEDKINHAYAFGGVEMSMNTVENLLDIPIDYYIKVNMEGFKDIVNTVGGVTVENDLDFTYDGVHFPKGELSLDGTKALEYSRMRYDDPRGDFGRQTRQRQIIEAVIKEGKSLSTIANYEEIFTILGKNVKTNLKFSELVQIQKDYKNAAVNIEQLTLHGSGIKIDDIYYISVKEKEITRLHNELKTHLDI